MSKEIINTLDLTGGNFWNIRADGSATLRNCDKGLRIDLTSDEVSRLKEMILSGEADAIRDTYVVNTVMGVALTETDTLALQGRLTVDRYNANGMNLFKKGLASLDPLYLGMGGQFPLTDLGKKIARELRK